MLEYKGWIHGWKRERKTKEKEKGEQEKKGTVDREREKGQWTANVKDKSREVRLAARVSIWCSEPKQAVDDRCKVVRARCLTNSGTVRGSASR